MVIFIISKRDCLTPSQTHKKEKLDLGNFAIYKQINEKSSYQKHLKTSFPQSHVVSCESHLSIAEPVYDIISFDTLLKEKIIHCLEKEATKY